MELRTSLFSLIRRFSMVLGLFALVAVSLLQAEPAFADSNAFVRVIHASPEAGAVEVFVDGKKLLPDFKFGTVTDYVAVAAGAHKIEVAPTGQPASAAVISQSVSVDAGVPYTVAAIGTKASGFSLQAFVDENRTTADKAKVRVYHLSPDAGPVDVATGGNKVITGLDYKQASAYLMVPAGSYTFDVTATEANATVQTSASLKSGVVTSVFAIGLLKGNPKLQFVAATTQGIPGMPNDGSDPNTVPASPFSQAPWLWLAGALALVLVSAAVLGRRLALARQPAQK